MGIRHLKLGTGGEIQARCVKLGIKNSFDEK